ncbi:MAG: hypothetical protein HFJ50_09340 [Clostridia bacterium]|jgi:hypothetical protein|nr:hypothetical protein [Clostridia bacterium]
MFKKICTYILVFFLIISFCLPVLGETDNFDEEMEMQELGEYINTVGAEIEDIPKINSRHAVVIDRKTRKSVIW